MTSTLEPGLTAAEVYHAELTYNTSISTLDDLDPVNESAPVEASTQIAEDTSEHPSADNLSDQLERLFQCSRYQVFEDGMESDFSRQLTFFILYYRHDALSELSSLLGSTAVAPEVSAEALRWIGRLHDPSTKPHRLWLLERTLSSGNPVIRDGAIVGLAALDDRRAIVYVARAIEVEPLPELRNDLIQLLKQLESPEQWYALSPQVHSQE